MRNVRMLIAGLLAACLAQFSIAAPPPVEAFGRIPAISNVALSPNGKLLAWEDTTGPQTMVVVHDLEWSKDRTRVPVDPGLKLRSVDWADDTTVLINVSLTHRVRADRLHTNEYWRTIAVDLDTKKSKLLLMDDTERSFVTSARLLSKRGPRPNTVTMASWDWMSTMRRGAIDTRIERGRAGEGWVYSAFIVDTKTGRGRVAEYGNQFTDDWVINASGTPVVRADWEPEAGRWTVLAKDGAGWKRIHQQTDNERMAIAGLAADGNSVLAVGLNGGTRTKLWSIALDGSGVKVLVEHPEADVAAVISDPLTDAPVAVRFAGLKAEDRVWLDKKIKARDAALRRSFPESDVWIAGRSEDYQRVVAGVDSPTKPMTFYFVDFGSGKATVVGEAYPGLSATKLGEVRSWPLKARDGYEIPAYVTIPPGVDDKNLPLVVLPHGGPESHDRWEFDWWAQFLATRGYAVLQPQFRGSTGYGEAHRKAGERQWGGLMQDDVTDSVKALVDHGLADPKRVCIVGHSYGGYAALAGAAFTPDLYSCAVSVNGVSDLPQLIGFAEREYGEESDFFHEVRRQLGKASEPRNIEKSPARNVAGIKVPVLLLHGVDDTVVPILHSQLMNDQLLRLNKPVTFVKLPGEDHWLSRSETRLRVLREIEDFLAAHLKPGTTPVAAGTP